MTSMINIDVVVEIPFGSNLKYEMDDNGNLRLDRILSSSMTYPGNYGFIENTLAKDGDKVDILILNEEKLIPGCIVNCKIIGALVMTDEKGLDEKILAVPSREVDPKFTQINEITDLSPTLLAKIRHFFEYYKKIDNNKWSQVDKFIGSNEAIKLIEKYKLDFLEKI